MTEFSYNSFEIQRYIFLVYTSNFRLFRKILERLLKYSLDMILKQSSEMGQRRLVPKLVRF
jgi:hypothetical protein